MIASSHGRGDQNNGLKLELSHYTDASVDQLEWRGRQRQLGVMGDNEHRS